MPQMLITLTLQAGQTVQTINKYIYFDIVPSKNPKGALDAVECQYGLRLN
jgi:hypothetical protein